MDERWSYVGRKDKRRWLWHALDRETRKVLAYGFGERKDRVFLELKSLLAPFGISHFIPMIGVLMSDILILSNLLLARKTHRK